MAGEEAAATLAAAVMDDYRGATLAPTDRAILDFAMALTERPAVTRAADLAPLRAAGLDDEAIHEVVQVVALFNYYNRLADGLGIDPEAEWQRDAE